MSYFISSFDHSPFCYSHCMISSFPEGRAAPCSILFMLCLCVSQYRPSRKDGTPQLRVPPHSLTLPLPKRVWRCIILPGRMTSSAAIVPTVRCINISKCGSCPHHSLSCTAHPSRKDVSYRNAVVLALSGRGTYSVGTGVYALGWAPLVNLQKPTTSLNP